MTGALLKRPKPILSSRPLEEYCAPGASYRVDQVPVDEGVILQVVNFTPATNTHRPAVIFVAGWVSHIDGWHEVLLEMTSQFPVLYVETRDKTSAQVSREADYSVAALAGDLAAVVAHYQLAPDDYIMLGSSLGGTAILECFHLLQAKPRCLVLIGPNAEFRLPPLGATFIRLFPPSVYLGLRPIIKLYLRLFRLDVKADYAQYAKYKRVLDAADPWKLKRGMLALATYQVWERLAGINRPTLVIGGAHDVMHEPGNLRRMVSMLPRGQYLDLGTNRATHSSEMVERVREYLGTL